MAKSFFSVISPQRRLEDKRQWPDYGKVAIKLVI
jgi:hypothetical protein